MENHFSILNKVVISVAIRLSKEGHDFKAMPLRFLVSVLYNNLADQFLFY
jgi:hypothetical protein